MHLAAARSRDEECWEANNSLNFLSVLSSFSLASRGLIPAALICTETQANNSLDFLHPGFCLCHSNPLLFLTDFKDPTHLFLKEQLNAPF